MVKEWGGNAFRKICSITVSFHFTKLSQLRCPEQTDLSMESKDSQRTKWLDVGFSVFILAFGLDTWK